MKEKKFKEKVIKKIIKLKFIKKLKNLLNINFKN